MNAIDAIILPASTRNFFTRVFLSDLAPHQDDASTGSEVFDGAVAVVEWFAANDAENNVVDADQAAAFIAWMTVNRETLVDIAGRAFDADE
jgi:hypothetical protein